MEIINLNLPKQVNQNTNLDLKKCQVVAVAVRNNLDQEQIEEKIEEKMKEKEGDEI